MKTTQQLNKLRLCFAALLLGVSAALLQSGCVAVVAGAAAGAGAMAYVRGELDATLDKDYDQVVRGATRAIEQLRFAKESEQQDALAAILVARTATNKNVEIKITKTSATLTKVAIRVGVFGDEAVSTTILEKIKANL